MTNNHLTDKRLAQLAKRNFCQTRGEEYTPFGDEVVSMAAELQERRKAEMDSEPYGFTDGDRRGMIYDPQYADRLNNPLPVYRHAQPAPVVMDNGKLRELFDAWFASDCSFDQSPEASDEDNIAWRESYWYVWQRCRTAMFNDKAKAVSDGFPSDEIECDICGHVSTEPEGRHHCCEDNSND